jgi:hypothetical protein
MRKYFLPVIKTADYDAAAVIFIKKCAKRCKEMSPEKGEYTFQKAGRQRGTLTVKGIYADPHFYQGVIFGGLEFLGYHPNVIIAKHEERYFELSVRGSKDEHAVSE